MLLNLYCLLSAAVTTKADKKYLETSQRMAHHYNSSKKTVVFQVGGVVSLRIPCVDRTNSDLPHLPCVVVEVKELATGYWLHSWRGKGV